MIKWVPTIILAGGLGSLLPFELESSGRFQNGAENAENARLLNEVMYVADANGNNNGFLENEEIVSILRDMGDKRVLDKEKKYKLFMENSTALRTWLTGKENIYFTKDQAEKYLSGHGK